MQLFLSRLSRFQISLSVYKYMRLLLELLRLSSAQINSPVTTLSPSSRLVFHDFGIAPKNRWVKRLNRKKIDFKVWNVRNSFIHRDTLMKPEDVSLVSNKLFEEFVAAQGCDLSRDILASSMPVKWSRPPSDFVKINFDAAVSEGKVGMGMIARNALGSCVAAKALSKIAALNPFFAECMAAREAVIFARSLHCSNIILEENSSLVIVALNREGEDLSEAGLCVKAARDVLSLFNSVKVSHVKRSGNQAAHRLAKFALSCLGPVLWEGVSPPFLFSVLSLDCSSV